MKRKRERDRKERKKRKKKKRKKKGTKGKRDWSGVNKKISCIVFLLYARHEFNQFESTLELGII